MRSIQTCGAGALLLAAHACALAQAPLQDRPQAAPMQQVVVKAGTDDQRLQSTTTTIVVGRAELLRHGDASLADALKRQPGITIDAAPGKPAAIRMRGMGGGYVAVLLNGLPAPAGFALESLDPEHIERVEILRAPTAETGGQAVAGTINVVLRGAARRGAGADEVKAGSAVVAGRAAPSLAARHDGSAGALAYTLGVTARRNQNPVSALATEEGRDPALLRRTAVSEQQVEDVLELSPRLSWQPDANDTFTSQSHVRKRRIGNRKREEETTQAGAPTAFPRAASSYDADALHTYADLAWTRRLDGGARLANKVSGYRTRREADFAYRGMAADGALRETHRVASGPRESEWTLSGSWKRPLWGSHALAMGWEAGRKRRDEYRREHQQDAAGGELLASDESYRATVARTAFFVQDEWDIGAAWSVYLGLRREDLRTRGEGNAHAAVDVGAGVWSPILQALFKPQAGAQAGAVRDQFRFAVGRSYKAPGIAQLMPRRYTVDNNNSPTNPDQQGNPDLRPELALGIDLAWERSFGKDGMLGVSAFHKRIRDIALDRVYQSDGVWIVTPSNQGGATVQGIEAEGRGTRGALSARFNLARNWSRVDSVPGPDNRIDGQAAWSGNVGLDYGATAFDAGASWNYRGRIATRASSLLANGAGARRQLDLYAVWKRGRYTRLRLSVADLLHQDHAERSEYTGAGYLARTTLFRARTTWRLAWEQTL